MEVLVFGYFLKEERREINYIYIYTYIYIYRIRSKEQNKRKVRFKKKERIWVHVNPLSDLLPTRRECCDILLTVGERASCS